MNWEHLIIAIITAFTSGGVVALLKFKSDTRVAEATIDKTQAEAWAILVENLSRRVAALEINVVEKDRRICELEKENQEKDEKIRHLEAEIKHLIELREARDAQIAGMQAKIDMIADESQV